jgi:hypothetical protein
MDIKATIHLSDSDIVQLIERFGAAALGGAISLPDPVPPTQSYADKVALVAPGTHVDVTHTIRSAPPPSDKDLKALLRRHLGKFHHIIPVEDTTNKLASDIIDLITKPQPSVSIRGGHPRTDTSRVVVKGLSLAQSVASHWKPPSEAQRFTRVDVAQWLRESGHNPVSATAVLAYLEGAGIVVSLERIVSKGAKTGGRTSKIVYTWGRRMRPDEDIHCHGPTGVEKVRKGKIPVVRHD